MYQNSPEHIANMMAARDKSFAAMTALKQRRIDTYLSAPKCCAECTLALPYEKRTNQFCNASCRTKYMNRSRAHGGGFHSAETKARIAKAVAAARLAQAFTSPAERNCAYCGNAFSPKRKRIRRAKYCSLECGERALNALKASDSYRQNMAEKGKANVAAQMAAGTWVGWPARNGPSFAEQFVCGELARAGLSFVTELKVSRYSIDVAFPGLMVALEVDGKQHGTPEHIAHDEIRDAFLESQGWRVMRIKWESIKREQGRAKVMSQIAEAIATVQSLTAAGS